MTKESSNWNNILYLKDIQIYLSFVTTIKLSFCNKKLRDRLYYDKFKPFCLRECLKKEGYQIFECQEEGKQDLYNNPYHKPSDTTLENTSIFENELQKLDISVKTLIFYDIYDYLYGYKIVERFDKIAILDLNLCLITRDLLQYLFNNLTLTVLSIKSTTVITEDCTVDIIMPQSLSKLKLYDFRYKLINLETGNSQFISKNGICDLQDLKLIPQHIPSLETLHYSSTDYFELTNFISLNPQLKSIKLHQDHIKDDIYVELSSQNQIKQLFIESFEFTRNYIFKLPVIHSLNTLTITLEDEFDYSMELIKAFPNITGFTVKYSYVVDSLDILWFASKFHKLKFLRLEFVEGLELDTDFDFPDFIELEVLEFTGVDEEYLNLDELCKGNKLKLVKFYDYPQSKKISVGSKVEEIGKWKIMNYNCSTVYYKH